VLGRGECSDALVEDDALSQTHFLIAKEGEGFLLIDLHSTNGTWVKGERVSAHKLCPKDVILAGGSLFFFSDVPTSTFLLPGIVTPAAADAGTRPRIRAD
jgi:pSer/pThr/pTyr-binding forkhead associated (FHA) protein